MDIQEKILELIRKEALKCGNVRLEHINMESSLIELGFDSIMLLQFTLELEDEFGLDIDDNDIDHELFNRIGNIASYLEERTKEVKPTI